MRRKGFTLIELLIVVAIIAILAAIAVPNFLEAQVRSKVSRVKADQRSLATAIEAYYVDNNAYPCCDSSTWTGTSGFGINSAQGVPGSGPDLWKLPTFRTKQLDSDLLHTLTTPISYITSYFVDPFAKTKGAYFGYSTPSTDLSLETQRSGWVIWSFGPDIDEVDLDGTGSDMKFDNFNAELTRISHWCNLGIDSFYDPNSRTPTDCLINVTYDPTNGSTSNGDVFRLKQ